MILVFTNNFEAFANSVGSAGSTMGSNGGLSDSSIATNYNTNKTSTIAQNNQVAGILTLTGQREDKAFIATRPLQGLGVLGFDHAATVIMNEDINYIKGTFSKAGIKEDDYVIHSQVDKNGIKQYFTVISGGPENENTNIKKPGNVVIDMSGKSDFNTDDVKYIKQYIANGEENKMQQYDNQNANNEQEIDINTIKNAVAIDNMKLNYHITPNYNLIGTPSAKDTYNSNSVGNALCSSSGSNNCFSLPHMRPGESYVIPNLKPINLNQLFNIINK